MHACMHEWMNEYLWNMKLSTDTQEMQCDIKCVTLLSDWFFKSDYEMTLQAPYHSLRLCLLVKLYFLGYILVWTQAQPWHNDKPSQGAVQSHR